MSTVRYSRPHGLSEWLLSIHQAFFRNRSLSPFPGGLNTTLYYVGLKSHRPSLFDLNAGLDLLGMSDRILHTVIGLNVAHRPPGFSNHPQPFLSV